MKSKYINSIIFWVIYGYLCIIPWISFKKDIKYNSEEKMLFISVDGVTDCFLYSKSVVTIFVAVLLLVLMTIKVLVYKEKILEMSDIKDRIVLICVCVYSACTIISCILSKYKIIALYGGSNSFEGTYVLLSYMIIFIASVCIFKTQRENGNLKKKIEVLTLVQCIILITLTVIEYFYKSIYSIFLNNYTYKRDNFMLTLTFYNPTYCAAFILLLMPFCMYFIYAAECIWKRLLWYFLSCFSLVCIILTKSTAGFYLCILEIAIFIITIIVTTFINKIYKRTLIGLLECLVIFIITILMCQVSGIEVIDATHYASVNRTDAIHKQDFYMITDIEAYSDKVILSGTDSIICAEFDMDNNLVFKDSNDEIIDVTIDGNIIYFPENYHNITAGMENDSLWFNLGYKGKIYFKINNEIFYPRLVDGSIVRDISGSGYIGKFDNLFTGRGYIWRSSLNILKNTIIFGHGAGTYEMYFKQFDYVGLLNSQGNVDLIIDKPHNWYIQMACNQGWLAMIAEVCIIVVVLVYALKNIIILKDIGNITIPAVIGIFVFCVFEMLTDSNITVNSVMWVVLGGIGSMNIQRKAND